MPAVQCVDLSDRLSGDAERRRRFDQTLRDGLLETGFIRVIGHGIADDLVERAHASFARFFALDYSQRMLCAGVAGGQRGYTPYGVEHARNHSRPDQKEFFHVGQTLAEPSPLCGRYPENVWPADMPELREAALALYCALESAAITLLEAIAEGFDLPVQTFSSMLSEGNSILRAVHYPPVNEDTDPEAFRAAPHEDINLITLLCNATDEGLEILARDGEWCAVEAHAGEIVADAGDMLSRTTNGRIPATTHRVVALGQAARRHRYALPFFAHPRPECDLSVIPAFVAPGEAPRHAPIDAGTFLDERLREIGLIP